ncbi:hypothetical protein [Gemmatimonas sp.]|uniref:hypothetical protein n=1 Tax=Gemmatimonas sp. TaxID=1962908 RepID=UPI0025BDA1A0|nr:hypothetical protein [Gemmatimonas sp.]MCA2992049.1 hypothetical protein [Gemmatimonas sp.]
MTHPGWQSKTQKRIALALVLLGAPVLYLWATSPIEQGPKGSRAVARAIGDFETAKAIKDKSRGCFYAGVVVSTMIAERDTAGARKWRDEERYVCERGF